MLVRKLAEQKRHAVERGRHDQIARCEQRHAALTVQQQRPCVGGAVDVLQNEQHAFFRKKAANGRDERRPFIYAAKIVPAGTRPAWSGQTARQVHWG